MPLDEHRRLPLAQLPPKQFEIFCLDFFLSEVQLRVKHDGAWTEATVKSADTFAPASGMAQDGIDLRLLMDSGAEWAVQCKRVRKFGLTEAREAVKKALGYQAQHYLLLVAGDTTGPAQKFIDQQPNWTMWNLDRICEAVRREIASERLPKLLHFLPAEQVRQFAPWTSHALVSPAEFFARTLGLEKPFRHDWRLVGRSGDLAALDAFAGSPNQKVSVLLSKGGDGKSRLLWEFSRDFVARHDGADVRFFNANSDHPIDPALLSSARPLIIVVDDAHREVLADAGRNPRFGQLLDAIRELPHARLILSSRPHALAALLNQISEAGLGAVREKPLHLSRLNRAEVRALAQEALGPAHSSLAGELLRLTRDSPFMTVMAGEFIRLGRIEWRAWASDAEFRREVFRRFEEENLKVLPESDRELARQTLRLVALLAPVPATPDFYADVAPVLSADALHIERIWMDLEQAEVLVGRSDAMRVAPDLFGDFLVFGVCFEPTLKRPAFVRRVLEAFAQKSPTLLHNLAEAAWVAQISGVADDAHLKPLIDAEFAAFRAESFHRRAERLARWQSFGVYLPRQSLALAQLALDCDHAKPDATLAEWSISTSTELDAHNYVLGKIAPLVAPVATYHEEHRDAALDLLWRLGTWRTETRVRMFDSAEPDEAIASVVKFEREKPVEVVLDALDWLRRKLSAPENLRRIEEQPSLLSAWLRPCFQRFVEMSGREGARFWFVQRDVSLENTRPIRHAALAIIKDVLGTGSWRAALAGVSALGNAIHRVTPSEVRRAENGDSMSQRWRPARLEGLEALHFALEQHDHFLVRYAVRALIQSDLAFEEDTEFAAAAHRVIESTAVDLDLRATVALLASGGSTDFLDESGEGSSLERMRRARERKDGVVREIAVELLRSYPTDSVLLTHLGEISQALRTAHYSPAFRPLFSAFARHAPKRAVAMARELLAGASDESMAGDFLPLIDNNAAVTAAALMDFLCAAVDGGPSTARPAVLRFLTWRAGQRPLSHEENALLMQFAHDPTPHELAILLDFLRWAHGSAIGVAVEVIRSLPVERLAAEHGNELLAAVIPDGAESEYLPTPALVAGVLSRLVTTPAVEMDSFYAITQKSPRQALDFVLARLRHAESAAAPAPYVATPLDWRLSLDLHSLVAEPDYVQLCDELWTRVLGENQPRRSDWIRLFQSVVLHEESGWPVRLLTEIKRADSLPRQHALLELLHFAGSLIPFRFPEIARAFLLRATALGGAEGESKTRGLLYAFSGPASRGYSGGELDPEDDYLEAEALKAAEHHRHDELLGPFYRWVVECEQRNRQWHRDDATASMAELEAS